MLQFFGGGSSKFFVGGLHRNTVNVWPVCILLECILVIKGYLVFFFRLPKKQSYIHLRC